MLGIESLFMQHVADFGLSYGTIEEFHFRQNLFMERHAELDRINSENSTFTVGHNFLSTWTAAEKSKLLGFKESNVAMYGAAEEFSGKASASEVNWIKKGGVNPVQNQEQCGSCWSFSTMAAVEGAHFVATGKLEKYAEEQLVECSKLNHGCNGGSMALAFRFLKKNFADYESKYPYTSGKGKKGSCQDSSDKHSGTKVTDFQMVQPKSSESLKAAIEKNVVSVAIEADKTVFQHYKTGVLTSTECGTKLDHGVAAVGYGSEDGQDYILVRNSWSADWGDKGYIKIGVVEMDGPGICGINMQPVFPTTD